MNKQQFLEDVLWQGPYHLMKGDSITLNGKIFIADENVILSTPSELYDFLFRPKK